MNLHRTAFPRGSARFRDASDSLVELGANSMKFHSFQSGYLHTVKFAYDLGHDVYRTGNVARSTERRIVNVLRGHGVPSFAIATSAVRDAQNSERLSTRMREELDLEMHVLSCFEESSLLARAFMRESPVLPALVVDIGGGSVEIVFLTRTKNLLWDSLPIGAIRLYHCWSSEGLSAMHAWIDGQLARASVVRTDEIFATGGTVKAMAAILGKTSFHRLDVVRLEEQVRRHGPPPGLKAPRAKVFLPGVILIRRLLEFVQAEALRYTGISVGRRALEEHLGARIPSVASRYFKRNAASGN